MRIAGIRREASPGQLRAVIVLAAADHGVAARGVSAYPQEVTAQMLANFRAGGAAVCVLARQAGAEQGRTAAHHVEQASQEIAHPSTSSI